MKNCFLFILVLLLNYCRGQNFINVKVDRIVSQNLKISTPLRTEQNRFFKVPQGYRNYFIKYHVFDEPQFVYEQYIKHLISEDSFSKLSKKMNLQPLYQSTKLTHNSIYVFIGMRQDSSTNIIIDVNCNNDFSDDVSYGLNDNVQSVFPFEMWLDYVNDRIVNRRKYYLEIVVNNLKKAFDHLYTDEFSTLIRTKSAWRGTLIIGKSRFNFEIYHTKLKAWETINTFSVNFSKPNKLLKKIDFRETLAYNAKNDTIISGNYRFKFVGIDLHKEIIALAIDEIGYKREGYMAGYRLPNFSLDVIVDTNEVVKKNIEELFKNRPYLLLDFWGTWCSPCIKSFPELRNIDSVYGNKLVSIAGVACEDKKDIKRVIETLTENKISWENVIVLRNGDKKDELLKFININSFPTYILLDRNKTILIRASGKDEILKVVNYLKKH